jgi:hypothetical protein
MSAKAAVQGMRDRILNLIFTHGSKANPIGDIGALLGVAAMMATRLGFNEEDWNAGCSAALREARVMWAAHDKGPQ